MHEFQLCGQTDRRAGQKTDRSQKPTTAASRRRVAIDFSDGFMRGSPKRALVRQQERERHLGQSATHSNGISS